ncbi:hypothetical protein KL86DYS1_30214 [uncultured Dysgonomonas sp.]|uniref:Uncharacterized protein n=2 Tax=uncultured Dysgonomonas sp. TaxID=206096 RepID=A0A212JRX8_9BACT|nr:hypothetical protein KL86DYS1_30214 [uncultured Dysgonomonas sp.]
MDRWKQDTISHIVLTDKLVEGLSDKELFDDIAADMVSALALSTQWDEDGKYLDSLICCDMTFQEAMLRFTRQVYEPVSLEGDSLGFSPSVTIVKSQDICKMFRKGNPDKAYRTFLKKYPGRAGFFQLSKVSYFSKYALVHFIIYINPLNGAGKIVILDKDSGEWKVLGHLILWLN